MTQSTGPAPDGAAATSASRSNTAVWIGAARPVDTPSGTSAAGDHAVISQLDSGAETEPGPTLVDGLQSAPAQPGDPHQPGPPTVRDVARIAGVSIATVSRVVNGIPHVRDTTRDAVLHAIALVGYERNEAAASMRRMHKGALPVDLDALSPRAVGSEPEPRLNGSPTSPSARS